MTTEEILFFDKLAADWDSREVRSTPARVSEILASLRLAEGMRILDLGTGTGVLLPFLSRMVGADGRVVAVDISEGMLARARQKFGTLANVDFSKLDFEAEDIAGRYDVIILYCVYPHLHSPKDTLRRLASQNLTPGGRIVIAFPGDESFVNGIHREKQASCAILPSAPELARLLRTWGFDARVAACDQSRYIVELRVS